MVRANLPSVTKTNLCFSLVHRGFKKLELRPVAVERADQGARYNYYALILKEMGRREKNRVRYIFARGKRRVTCISFGEKET